MIVAIITAGGIGKRFPGKVKKQFKKIKRKEVLLWVIEKFIQIRQINEIIVTLPADELVFFSELIERAGYHKSVKCITGGVERQDSVYNALMECPDETEIVLIHDGVRPLVYNQEIDVLIEKAKKLKSVIPVKKVKNTIKQIQGDLVEKTISRENLVEVYTPQVFDYSLLKKYYEKAQIEGIYFTDDAGLLENYGVPVHIHYSESMNIKITDESDLKIAKQFFKQYY